jgi:F-type H+-transporting ATPase subunit delta
MAQKLHTSPVAVAYAQSILDLANEQKQVEPIGLELATLRQIVDENPSFRDVLANPGISTDDRAKLLSNIFRGKISTLLFNTIGVLNRKGRLGLLPEIAVAYSDLLDKQLGKVEVDLRVAQKLEPAQLEAARRSISAALGKDAVLHQYVDESVIGGVVLRVGDKLIDASVRHQLASMRKQLMASAPK